VKDLAPGALLGHYKIVRTLGQGGMGVVYEAVDQKLGRHVAVKVLANAADAPATRDSDPARERFWREARAASSLNHPGICIIHELDETAVPPFLVLELLEGSSLEKLYNGHAMPYPKLVAMGIQLADALDAAHRKGILHRDIKPANIFITSSDQAKLLDFGLAKLDEACVGSDGSTAVIPLTDSGSAVGTVAYMSPEQARGDPLDLRSDLFSLGVVLYEMATGHHPFSGSTTAVVFDRILNHPPPPPISLNPELTVEFENILSKTLEKDRELRCQSAAELRADLKRLQRNSSSGSVRTPAVPATSSPQIQTAQSPQASNAGGIAAPAAGLGRRAIVALTVLIVLGIAGFLGWRLWPRSRPFAAVSVEQITHIGSIEEIALSADARFLVEVKNDKGQRTVWVRNTATNTETQVLGAFGHGYLGLTFSPDGNHLYFTRLSPENEMANDLYGMPVFGGTPRQLIFNVDSPVSFEPNGKRVTYLRWSPERKDEFAEIHIADKDGGNDQVLYSTAEKALAPVWSPDGRRIAWLQAETGTTRVGLKVIEISSKRVTTVAPPAGISWVDPGLAYTTLAWMPDSLHLLTLYYKQHSDRAQIGVITAPSGEFHSVTNDVNSYSELALSGNGRTLATVLNNVDSNIALYGPDRGEPISTLPLRITPNAIAWATEDRLLYIVRGSSIGTIDRATGSVQSFDTGEITPGGFIASCTDGHILFTGFPNGSSEARLFRMKADGGEIAQLTSSGFAQSPSCSADSQKAYYSIGSDVNVALWSVPVSGGTPKQLIPALIYDQVSVSRDGTQVALFALRQQKLCAIITDLGSGRMQTPFFLDQSLATFSKFSPDGRAIITDVLRNGGNTLLYQPLNGSTPYALFNPVPETINDFDWSPSGKQLAVARLKSSSDVVLIIDQAGKETR
jgi:Tol biopolymer transport system component/tRNA A-37 threonylcarbamoyl transferase component Bud32